MPYSDHDYLDPIEIVWRSGNEDDPYIDRVEYLKVVNQKLILAEIPDRFHRVKLLGLEEVNVSRITHNKLEPNQYSVDYATGIVLVHKDMEAKTITAKYKGRGFIMYPASRIYHVDEFKNVVVSLEEIIRRSEESVKNLNDSIDGKITDYNQIRDMMLDKLAELDKATDIADESLEKAEIIQKEAEKTIADSRLIFKNYVSTFDEIKWQYPNAEVGWTTQVYDTGIRYRYDGKEWKPIDLFGGNIQDASEDIRGLMSAEDYKKLHGLDKLVGKSAVDDTFVIMCFPFVDEGVNSVIARFPFNKGEIQSIDAFAMINDSPEELIFDIETTQDYKEWKSIFKDEKGILFGEYEHDSYSIYPNNDLEIKEVGIMDKLRMTCKGNPDKMEGLTIELKIKIL